MQKIIWIGQPLFAPYLSACGFESVKILSPAPGHVLAWADILKAGMPDVVVVACQNNHLPLVGVEALPCLTIFVPSEDGVQEWQAQYAQGFDICMAQHEAAAHALCGISHTGATIWIIHSFADEFPAEPDMTPASSQSEFRVYPSSDPACLSLEPCGSLPLPHKILSARDSVLPGTVVFYPGMDFSDSAMFNHMAQGACVVAPRTKIGIEKLFVDGEHWVGYAPRDGGDALYRLNFLMEHPELVIHIAEKARASIYAEHTPEHRAWAFTDLLCGLAMTGASELIAARRARARELRSRVLESIYTRMAVNSTLPKQ